MWEHLGRQIVTRPRYKCGMLQCRRHHTPVWTMLLSKCLDRGESTEASGLQACRGTHQTTDPPNLPKPPNQSPGGGLLSPYPLPPVRLARLQIFSCVPVASLKSNKNVSNMCISCLWARLDRTQGDMICIERANRRLYAQSHPKVTSK